MLTSAQLALSKQREADEYRESLETSLRASKRMKSLVDGLLTLAHIDGGRFELNRSEFDLGSLAGECIELLQPLARERGINIESQLQQVMVNGDSDRLAQVLTNLLTNAVRYNRDGGTVTLSIRQDDRATVVSVADTGLGIPADDLPNIFDRFYRVDKVRSRADGGSGLGLSICRTIVEAHEGAITATSKLGSGTCLEIRLPRNNGVQS